MCNGIKEEEDHGRNKWNVYLSQTSKCCFTPVSTSNFKLTSQFAAGSFPIRVSDFNVASTCWACCDGECLGGSCGWTLLLVVMRQDNSVRIMCTSPRSLCQPASRSNSQNKDQTERDVIRERDRTWRTINGKRLRWRKCTKMIKIN